MYKTTKMDKFKGSVCRELEKEYDKVTVITTFDWGIELHGKLMETDEEHKLTALPIGDRRFNVEAEYSYFDENDNFKTRKWHVGEVQV